MPDEPRLTLGLRLGPCGHNGMVSMFARDEFIYVARVAATAEDSRYRLAHLTRDRPAGLDVGCAVGYIGEFLRRGGARRWLAGIEIDPGAAEKARPHYDQVIVGSIE